MPIAKPLSSLNSNQALHSKEGDHLGWFPSAISVPWARFYSSYSLIMRQNILLLLICALSLSVEAQDNAEAIADIRSKYAVIAESIREDRYRKVEAPFTCDIDPIQGELSFYYDGDALRHISYALTEGDHVWQHNRYYVWGDSLFFMFREAGYWVFDPEGSPEGELSATIDYYTEERFYFDAGAPFRCLEKNWEERSTGSKGPGKDAIPNQTVDCAEATEVLEQFRKLKAYRDNSDDFDPCEGF